jgi:flagellar motility protein MotE (MotC chaperone)
VVRPNGTKPVVVSNPDLLRDQLGKAQTAHRQQSVEITRMAEKLRLLETHVLAENEKTKGENKKRGEEKETVARGNKTQGRGGASSNDEGAIELLIKTLSSVCAAQLSFAWPQMSFAQHA